ncbi:MAG: DoxX family protein [Bacteroidia bacterium]|nr:DoxX family protein [Bacteroidia bacterium]
MKRKILFTVCLLFGLIMINGGLDKLFHYMPLPENVSEDIVKAFGAFTQIGWLMPLVGVAEILGGLLFIIPKTRAIGALILLPVFVGILMVNTITDATGLPIVIILLAILGWAMFDNRQKYLQLIKH